jgi:hypothetical protein
MEVEWDMLQVHSVVTENSAVKSEGMSLKEVGHSADGVGVSRGSDSADGNSADAGEEFIDECEPTPRERQAISRSQEPKWKTKRKLKNSPRKAVEQLFKEVDHTICGAPCAKVPTPVEIEELNKEFVDVFPEKIPGGLPPKRVTDHRIDLKPGSKVPAQRLYRLAPLEDAELQKQLKSLLDLGFIEPATSEYGAGILFVPKANGKLRLCVDYRPLNAITVVDTYPLPRIDEMIDFAGGARIYSKLDLHAGFHQIRIHPEHVGRTAFKTKYGTYQWRVMPFGLCNAPSTFQRTMDLLLTEFREFMGAYVDDILVHTNTMEEHLSALRMLYVKLRKEKLFASPEKCEFGQPEVEYCGFIVGRLGIRPQPRKLMAVYKWPSLKDPTDVKSFLGLCGFYQRFVQDYATVAAPLTDLMKKKKDWVWGEKQEAAFQELKLRLLKYPVLIPPNYKKPMLLHTDASEVGVGATLSQEDEEGKVRLIACRSKKLSPSEKNYPVHEKEMLALVDTLEEWRHYLLGADVRVFTDNSALTYLQKSPKPSPRQVRWLEKMQRYTLKIQHVPGRLNSAADALSRHPVEESVLALMVMEYSAKHSVSLVSVWFDGPICAPLRMGEEVSADW